MNTIRDAEYFWCQRRLFCDPARKLNVWKCQTGQDGLWLCGCPQLLPPTGFVVVPNCSPPTAPPWLSPTAPPAKALKEQVNTRPNAGYFWCQRRLFGDPARKSNVGQCQTGQDDLWLCGCPQLLVPWLCGCPPTAPPNCSPGLCGCPQLLPNCSPSPTVSANCFFPGYFWCQRRLFGDPARKSNVGQCQTGQDDLWLCGCPQLLPPTATLVPNCYPANCYPRPPNCFASPRPLALWLSPTAIPVPNCHSPTAIPLPLR